LGIPIKHAPAVLGYRPSLGIKKAAT